MQPFTLTFTPFHLTYMSLDHQRNPCRQGEDMLTSHRISLAGIFNRVCNLANVNNMLMHSNWLYVGKVFWSTYLLSRISIASSFSKGVIILSKSGHMWQVVVCRGDHNPRVCSMVVSDVDGLLDLSAAVHWLLAEGSDPILVDAVTSFWSADVCFRCCFSLLPRVLTVPYSCCAQSPTLKWWTKTVRCSWKLWKPVRKC